MLDKGKRVNRFLALIMVCMIIVGQIAAVAPVSLAGTTDTGPALVITGTGINQDVFISAADWNAMQERHYSSNNSYNFHKILKVRGYDLFDLIGTSNLKTDQDYPVRFIASDGFSLTKSVQNLKSLSYYQHFTSADAVQVAPMIGYYYKELISDDTPEPPVAWTDQTLTTADADANAPRIYFGQNGIDDKNQSNFVRSLVRIVVGEERPSIFTVRGTGVNAETSFNITRLKSLPAAYQFNEPYAYTTQNGNQTANIKGVDLWYLLNTVVGIKDAAAQVQFVCSDGYIVAPVSQADLANPALKYVLAYEVNGAAISDDSGKACLRIYRKQASAGELYTITKAISAVEINGQAPSTDFSTSPFKHITYTGLPYNVDSITGATMTIEGPGVETYRALSLAQIEGANAGLFRGAYAETVNGQEVQSTYEGVKVSYLLDNFISLRSNAGTVVFKDKSRQTIAEYSLDQIRRTTYRNNTTGAANLPMIVAYGINEVPLVYSNVDTGYVAAKRNDNGCFKLICGQNAAGDAAPAMSNVAYMYVKEADAAGVYEHTQAPYNDPQYTNYILTLTGSGLGKEINFSVADLEAMQSLQVEKEYSLSNSAYFWYYNKYKGIPLWDLLVQQGLDPNIPETTPVSFEAADYYNVAPMTIADIKNDNLYGYYEKSVMDLGNGTFDGSGVAPLNTDYPVLIAYGFNGYPYVIRATDPGYNSGLGNNGGPLRVIFGKKSYGDINGSHQVQLIKRIIIGNDTTLSTHSYSPYSTLGTSPITIKVVAEDGSTIKEQAFSVKDIEDMLYGAAVPKATADSAREKQKYFTKISGTGDKISDLYEGVGLNYLLFQKIGLPGTTGTVTFTDQASTGTLTVPLQDIVKSDYFNEVTGSTNLKPVLAFAKNGYPMVKTKTDTGYIATGYNNNGPLVALFGQTTAGAPGANLANVQKITVQITSDKWAHMKDPYQQYTADTLTVKGSGVRAEHSVTVGQLESMQNYIINGNYCLANSASEKTVAGYRGIDIYEYLRKVVGFTAGATSVTFKSADATSQTFTMEQLAKRDYINELSSGDSLPVMLAYGKNETPLVANTSSPGYVASVQNDGGPLRLIIGQSTAGDLNASKTVASVKEIIVEAAAGDSWKHDHGAYTGYQDQAVLRVTGSQIKTPRTFNLRQLEAMNQYIIRDIYNSETPVEGIILRNLIKDVVGLQDGVSEPSSIRVFSGAGFNQIANTNQVLNGVVNSKGLTKEIILGYGVNGYPLVPQTDSNGYVNNNQFGPVRLIVEENTSMWIKWTDCIVVGTGSYEQPQASDVITEPGGSEPNLVAPEPRDWSIYRNDNSSGLPAASVRCVTPDGAGGLWVGTNGGGAAYRNPNGQWTTYDKTNSPLPHNTIYAIAVDNAGSVWFAGGSPEAGMGIVCKEGQQWTIFNKTNSPLPADFAQAIALDNQGGAWFGTSAGPVYRDKDGNWTVQDKTTLPASSVTAITPDNQGGVWFGFYPDQATTDAPYKGGYAYRNAQGQVTAYSEESTDFAGKWVRSIAIDPNGGVWVARFGKVDYIAPNGTKTVYAQDSDLLPFLSTGDSIRAVVPDKTGGLWIGTTTSGLFYRYANGDFSNYNAGNTWPITQFNSVWTINAGANGGLWLGTNGGVAGFGKTATSKGVYTVAPVPDAAYAAGTTSSGINTMTVNSGINGFKYFAVTITPVTPHNGNETVIFTHLRAGRQLGINAAKADFDFVQTAEAGFNVQAGDVVKAYLVDDLTNNILINPVVLQ